MTVQGAKFYVKLSCRGPTDENDYKNAFQDVAQVGGLEAGLWSAKVPHQGIAIFRLIHAFV
jgi:hypothetical protein